MTNKKIIALSIAMVLTVCIFTACNHLTVENTLETVSITESATEISSTDRENEETTAPKSTEITESISEESRVSGTATPTSTTSKVSQRESNTSSAESKSSTTKRATSESTTSAPKVTTTTAKQTTTKQETTTKKPVTTTQPTTTAKQIDIDSYISYAISYGKSIGLTYNASVTESWDTPIIITSTNAEYAKRDIKDRLDAIKYVDGFSYFGVWAEKQGDRYELYVAYA